MTGTILSALYLHTYESFDAHISISPWLILAILQMCKLRHSELNNLPKTTQLVKGRAKFVYADLLHDGLYS